MPIYEFLCRKDKIYAEKFQKFEDKAPVCPKCEEPMERMMSRSKFIFKGKGFYTTDYGKGMGRDGTSTQGQVSKEEAEEYGITRIDDDEDIEEEELESDEGFVGGQGYINAEDI